MQIPSITIKRGSYLDLVANVTKDDQSPRNLTNLFINTVMKKIDNTNDDTYTLNCDVTSAIDGVIKLSLTDIQTDLLEPGQYTYDVLVSFNDSNDNLVIEKIFEGEIVVE
jgi:hypothetical protein